MSAISLLSGGDKKALLDFRAHRNPIFVGVLHAAAVPANEVVFFLWIALHTFLPGKDIGNTRDVSFERELIKSLRAQFLTGLLR